jgi:DNA helicase-2/ATP-dependent DNA helicase PcrA
VTPDVISPFRRLTDPGEVGELLGVPFTPDQREAIGAPLEPMVVMAGAGSGKTAVMAARVVWLVGSGQVAPHEVLGLTFTNKAAAELSTRIRTALARLRVGESVPRHEADPDDGEPTVGTYHAYAARLLTEQGLRLGLEPDARLLTDALRFQLGQRVLRQAPGPFPHFDKGLTRMTELLLMLDAELNEHLVSTDDVRRHDRDLLATLDATDRLTSAGKEARATALARLDLLDLVDDLRARKRALSVLDFGDQLALAARLVREHPQVGLAERERFAVVLLDEYQDTSVAQKRLLLDLFGAGHPVTAVGDPFQAIYGWRGASVRNIVAFADEFVRVDGTPALRVGLHQNNRSYQRVLDAANAVAAPLRVERPDIEPLVPRPDHVGKGTVRAGVFLTADEELAWGTTFVRDQVAQGRPPGEIAVLSRTTREIAAWYSALLELDVPVEVVGLGGLLAIPEIVDLVSTLEVLDDPTANPAMIRLLTGPRWRLGAADLRALGQRAARLVSARRRPDDAELDPDARLAAALADAVAQTDEADLVALVDAVLDPGDAALTPEGRRRVAMFAAEFDELRAMTMLPLPDLVTSVIARTGLDAEVAVRDGAERRNESLTAFVQAVADFTDLDGEVSLRSLLTYLDVSRRDDRGLGGASPSSADSVKLMTMHASKGLEFPLVVLPDVTTGVFPSTQGRSTWLTTSGALPSSLRGDADDFPVMQDWSGQRGAEAFRAALRDLAETEERRLAYVAMTRAEHELVMTSHWWGRTQKKLRGPSPYLLAAAQESVGVVDRVSWVAAPTESENPFLGQAQAVQWPAPVDAQRRLGIADAADAVRARMRAASEGAVAGEPGVAIGHGSGADAAGEDSARITEWERDASLLIDEIVSVHAPITQVPLPRSLTASALVDLNADPEAFARRLRRPMPRPPARAAGRGTRFHAWVEQRFGQRPLLDREDLVGAADDALDIDDAELAALQAAFEAGPFADRPPLHVEAPFTIVLGDRVVRGRIDAVYATDDGFDVIDWKTGSRPSDPIQLAVYRLGWAAAAGVDPALVTAGFYVVREGRIDRPTLLDRDGLEKLFDLPM